SEAEQPDHPASLSDSDAIITLGSGFRYTHRLRRRIYPTWFGARPQYLQDLLAPATQVCPKSSGSKTGIAKEMRCRRPSVCRAVRNHERRRFLSALGSIQPTAILDKVGRKRGIW